MKTVAHRIITGVIVLLSFFLYATPAKANPAILMGPSICDNQADVFDYVWKTQNVSNTKLFFISGNNQSNGKIHAVNHQDNFDNSQDVYIMLHGDTDVVSTFNGTDFAKVFFANHQTAPKNVTMYVCKSGTIPPNGVSSMAKLARLYPGQTLNSTKINMTAANGCPALRGSQGNNPIQPIHNIASASYKVNPSQTSQYPSQLNLLLKGWAQDIYPQTNKTYEDYCEDQLIQDKTGRWVDKFIKEVNNKYDQEYLKLINYNYGGNPFANCGPQNQCN